MYNLYIIKLTKFKHTIWCVFTNIYSHVSTTQLWYRTFSSPLKDPPRHFVVKSVPHSPGKHWFAFYLYNFCQIFKLVIISLQKVVKTVIIPVLNLVNLQGSKVIFCKSSSKFVYSFIYSFRKQRLCSRNWAGCWDTEFKKTSVPSNNSQFN